VNVGCDLGNGKLNRIRAKVGKPCVPFLFPFEGVWWRVCIYFIRALSLLREDDLDESRGMKCPEKRMADLRTVRTCRAGSFDGKRENGERRNGPRPYSLFTRKCTSPPTEG